MNFEPKIILPTFFTITILWLCSSTSHALTFKLPENGDNIVGRLQQVESQPGDNFSRLGRRYDIGYYEMVEANPSINPDAVMTPGTKLVVPTRFILPAASRTGVVLNLAELRLYYYPPGGHVVVTHPVGIGREGWDTPSVLTHITTKVKDPTWYVPQSIREARAREGVELPETVPPGPENPLGGYEFRLAITGGSFLMHGTNDASGVGRRSSSGCIRMFPEDVESLYDRVPVKTSVRILNEPYKVGWEQDKLYLEAHLPLQEQMHIYSNTLTPMVKLISGATRQRSANVDWQVARKVINMQNGYPVLIGVATEPVYHRSARSKAAFRSMSKRSI
jgi:L,D-transpeptidase ErfK/SrfK